MRLTRPAIVLTTLCLLTSAAAAQSVPPEMNFAARLSDSEGLPLDGQRDLVLKLFDAPTGGTELWAETHAAATFARGLVYLSLGGNRPLDATVFDGGDAYLEVTVDGTVMSPRLGVGSVPYAVRADVATTAENFGTLTPTDVVTSITAGAALTGGGSGNNVTLGLQSCSDGQYLAFAAGAWGCANIPVPITFANTGGDFGVSGDAARADHYHDSRYFTKSELRTAANVINGAANPVAWANLHGVPGGIADGIDSDTLYGAGAGLNLAGTTFSVGFTASGGDNGTAVTVARGDHAHDGRYPIMAGRSGGQTLIGGTGANEPLVLRPNTAAVGEVRIADTGGRVVIGNGTIGNPSLDINGDFRYNAVHKVGSAAPTLYETSVQRYVVDAPPSAVGVVVSLDNSITDDFCRDLDGCSVTLAMINWDQPGQPGNRTSTITHLGISQTSRWWRFSEHIGAPAGQDAAGGVQEMNQHDCYFGDAETYTGTPNGRADAVVGWGLLNCAGCNYSDATVTCRVIIED